MNTILHIENSDVFRKLISDRFTRRGWEYRHARSAEEAFVILGRERITMIITALEVGEGGGEDFVKRLSGSPHREIPVVVMSSNASVEVRTRLYESGILDFIPKKINMETMAGYIDRLIREDEISLSLQNLKIAVVDDSEIQLEFIRRVFDCRGITNVSYFNNPADLLGAGREFNVYLVDIVLPGISGDQVIYELRGKYRNSVMIAMSTVDHYKTVSSVLLTGADDYLLKPLDENVFMARLKSNVRTYLLLKELEEKNITLQEMAVRDGLTQLYNHRYLYERLENEIEKARRYGRSLSVIMFDVDHFKSINDRHGHRVGDVVLTGCAGAIRAVLRDTDVLGRYGGEEFLAILPETGIESAVVTARRVIAAVEKSTFHEQVDRVTVSAGVAELVDENAHRLVEAADKCLYLAKNGGRNRAESRRG